MEWGGRGGARWAGLEVVVMEYKLEKAGFLNGGGEKNTGGHFCEAVTESIFVNHPMGLNGF